MTRRVYTLPSGWAVRGDGVRIWDLLYERWHALRSPAGQNLPLPVFVGDVISAAAEGTGDDDGEGAVAEGGTP